MATEYPLRDETGQIVALMDSRPAAPADESVAAQVEPEPRRSRAIAPGEHRPLSEHLPRTNGTAPHPRHGPAPTPRSQLALVTVATAGLRVCDIPFRPGP